jgi:hypothetical protein
VHALNPTAAWVWQQLDGQTETKVLAARLVEQFPEVGALAEHVLWASLKRLDEKHLLSERLSGQIAPHLETRRRILKQMGVALAFLPVVITLAAPPPIHAQTFQCRGCFTNQIDAEIACGPSARGMCWTSRRCRGKATPNLTPAECWQISSSGGWEPN